MSESDKIEIIIQLITELQNKVDDTILILKTMNEWTIYKWHKNKQDLKQN